MAKNTGLTVSNIQKKIYNIHLKDTPYASLQHLVPNIPHAVISFELHQASVAFANAIRRCLTNELELKYLTVDMADIDIPNGTNIVKEVVLQRIESIPINQSISPNETFKLYKNNNTLEWIDVNSDSILPISKKAEKKDKKEKKEKKEKNSKPENAHKLFTDKITICSLDVNQYICIDNIHIASARGKDNGRAALGIIGFKVLNQDMNVSSLTVHPTSFQFRMETNGNFNQALMDPIYMVIGDLERRLTIIENALKGEEYDQGVHYSTEFNVFKLFVPNESHTIGNLMKQYIYNLDPSIEYVNYRIIHPSKEEMVVDIKNHTDPKKICMDAITSIKKDLHTFESFFMKNE